jgi:transcriptional regulator with XRE-family HTH domain
MMETFAVRLLRLMNEQRIGPVKLAQGAGVAHKSILKYIRGEGEPKMYALIKLAQFFEVSIDYLCLGDLNEKATRRTCTDVPASGECGHMVPV